LVAGGVSREAINVDRELPIIIERRHTSFIAKRGIKSTHGVWYSRFLGAWGEARVFIIDSEEL
jgi:hypothetical protein